MTNRTVLCFAVLLTVSSPGRGQGPRARSLQFDPAKQQWVEQAIPATGTPEGDLYQIKRLSEGESHRKALAAIKRFIKQYGTDAPLYPDALIEKARAFIGVRNFTDAHETLQSFLGEFGGTALTEEALRMEVVTAEAFLAGAKRRVWKIFWFSGKDLAYRILDEVSAGYPDSRYAQAAIKTKADHLYREGEFDLAELEYARLLRDYPRTQYHQFAMRRTADAALASFGGVDYDEAALIEADERYREYRATYPDAAQREGADVILEGIRQSRAEKDFLVGRYYEKTKQRDAAVFYYELVVHDWPGTVAESKATSRLRSLGAIEAPASDSNSVEGP